MRPTLRFAIPAAASAIAAIAASAAGAQETARDWLAIALLWLILDGVQR